MRVDKAIHGAVLGNTWSSSRGLRRENRTEDRGWLRLAPYAFHTQNRNDALVSSAYRASSKVQ